MKFSIYALALLGFFAFSSCEKDDDSVKLDSTNIQGTWNLTTYDSDTDVSIGVGLLVDKTNTVSSISNSTVTVTFKADGTWTSEGDYTLTTTSEGTTETDEISDGIGGGTYTLADGQLTMSDIDAGDEADIASIDFNSAYTPDTRIDLNADVTEMTTDPFFGLDVTIDLMLNMVLEK